MKAIYLDNAASMPMFESVIKEVAKISKQYYANPFSSHSKGLEARRVLIKAKQELAKELGVKEEEIILTSGSTESNSLALLKIARQKRKEGKNKIIISSIEHGSVYENAKNLEKEGFTVKEIPVNENSGLDIGFLQGEIDDKTALVSIISVNSDIGIINDIPKIAKICKERNVILHVDHTQGFGKTNMQPSNLGVSLLSADAQKIGGPRGIGLLYVKTGLDISRLGTPNVSGAAGFFKALKEYKKINWKNVEKTRQIFEKELENIGGRITAKSLHKAQTHIHVCFKDVDGNNLVNYLSTKGIYCSTGSACDSNNKDKRILNNLGVPKEFQTGAIRFSLSKPLTKKEIDYIVKEIKSYLNRFKNVQK